jgi:hypothetical protein
MNKPLDPKDLVNPFVIPSPLSLLDVFNIVRDGWIAAPRRRDLLSALRRIEELTVTPIVRQKIRLAPRRSARFSGRSDRRAVTQQPPESR